MCGEYKLRRPAVVEQIDEIFNEPGVQARFHLVKKHHLVVADNIHDCEHYPEQDFVGVIIISGTIQDTGSSDLFTTVEYDHQGILDFVDDMMNNNSNTGLFLNIDSPGGYTYEIVELYDKLMEYKKTTKRPIYA